MTDENTPAAPQATATKEELLQANAELTAKVNFLNKKLHLVGSITRHDVLNQLTAIVGYNELLRMMIEDPKLKSFLEKERTAIDKIRCQFQYAKDYQNIAVEPPRWQNIRNLVSLVSENLDLKGVRISVETGDAMVLADPLFSKIFYHLFDNSLHHGVTTTEIRITLKETSEGGVIIVEDNGKGIPAEEKCKVFERGYGKGTGWGLFLSREILAISGMSITETGEPGSGARFEISIPQGMLRMKGAE